MTSELMAQAVDTDALFSAQQDLGMEVAKSQLASHLALKICQSQFPLSPSGVDGADYSEHIRRLQGLDSFPSTRVLQAVSQDIFAQAHTKEKYDELLHAVEGVVFSSKVDISETDIKKTDPDFHLIYSIKDSIGVAGTLRLMRHHLESRITQARFPDLYRQLADGDLESAMILTQKKFEGELPSSDGYKAYSLTILSSANPADTSHLIITDNTSLSPKGEKENKTQESEEEASLDDWNIESVLAVRDQLPPERLPTLVKEVILIQLGREKFKEVFDDPIPAQLVSGAVTQIEPDVDVLVNVGDLPEYDSLTPIATTILSASDGKVAYDEAIASLKNGKAEENKVVLENS